MSTVFSIARKPILILVALTAGAVAMVASSPSGARSPGINGTLMFGGNVGKTRQLFTIRPDGTGMRQLTHLAGSNSDATWSPDNRRIAFARSLPKYAAIYVINADATGLRRVSHFQFAGDPAWSPDGRRIVFARADHKPRFETGITLADADGRHVVKLTRGRFGDHPGDFSPDGRFVTFVRGQPSRLGHLRDRRRRPRPEAADALRAELRPADLVARRQ